MFNLKNLIDSNIDYYPGILKSLSMSVGDVKQLQDECEGNFKLKEEGRSGYHPLSQLFIQDDGLFYGTVGTSMFWVEINVVEKSPFVSYRNSLNVHERTENDISNK